MPNEYNPRRNQVNSQTGGNLEVLIPSVSYGVVPVAKGSGIVIRDHRVRLRDVTGHGGGTYDLKVQDNRRLYRAGFRVIFTASPGSGQQIFSVAVPANGFVDFQCQDQRRRPEDENRR